MNLVTPKAGAKQELLFNIPASGCWVITTFVISCQINVKSILNTCCHLLAKFGCDISLLKTLKNVWRVGKFGLLSTQPVILSSNKKKFEVQIYVILNALYFLVIKSRIKNKIEVIEILKIYLKYSFTIMKQNVYDMKRNFKYKKWSTMCTIWRGIWNIKIDWLKRKINLLMINLCLKKC